MISLSPSMCGGSLRVPRGAFGVPPNATSNQGGRRGDEAHLSFRSNPAHSLRNQPPLRAPVVRSLGRRRMIVVKEGWALDAEWWKQMREAAAKLIDSEHAKHPERGGVAIPELKPALEREGLIGHLFALLIDELLKDGFKQSGANILRATHQAALPPHLEAAGQRVRARLSGKPLDPPSRKEIAPDAAHNQALRFLIQTNEAISLSDDVVLLSGAFEEAAQRVRRFLETQKTATASELDQALGTSRRVLIPLLEKLDQKGVTRREGDKRVLRG
jgi:selenocysteine-specific elongation factor